MYRHNDYKPVKRNLHTCPECHGKGTTVCHTCKGHGRNESGLICLDCNGRGRVSCLPCDGSGNKEISFDLLLFPINVKSKRHKKSA